MNFQKLLFIILSLFVSIGGYSQVVVNEVFPNGTVELKNIGNTTVDVGSYWLCDFPQYDQLRNLNLLCGDLNMEAGSILAVETERVTIDAADGEMGLYLNNSFGSSSSILDYVEWGFSGHGRSNVAVSAGIWSTGQFEPAITAGASLSLSGSGDFVIQDPTVCEENDEQAMTCNVSGGTLTGGPFTFCIDGVGGDNIAAGAITVTGNSGANTQVVVTDDQGNILGLPPSFEAVDFEGAGEGTCLIWYLSYEGSVTGLEVGSNASDLAGCFSLSNSVTVYRQTPDGGTVQIAGGGDTFAFCAGQIMFDVEHTTTAPNLSYWYIITDDQNNILGFANSAETNSLDLSAAPPGTCRVWGWSYRGLNDPVIGGPLSQLTDDPCETISDNFITVFREVPDGGSVTLINGETEYVGTAGDIVVQVQHTTTAPNISYWYIITDDQDNILGFANSANTNTLDLSAAPPGTCRIWGWNYRGLDDPIVGDPITTLNDDFCEAISQDFITVVRQAEGANDCNVSGGTLTGGPFTFCIDGVGGDNIAAGAITVTGNSGANTQVVVTDDQGNILGLPPSFEAVDFEGAGEGTCLIWYLSYEGSVTGLEVGSNASDLAGCFSLSNSVTVYRQTPDGGTVQIAGGGDTFAFCAGQIMFDVEHTTTAPNLSYWYIITDDQNNILGFANSAETNSLDLSAAPPGTCRVWGWSYRGLNDPVIGGPLSQLTDDPCETISDNFITVFREVPDGGSVTLINGETEYVGTAGDIVVQVQHTTTAPNISYWYIITDDQDNILGFANSANTNTLDLSAAPPGTCRIWGWNYRGLDDPIVGDPITTLNDDFCEAISQDFITVVREPSAANVLEVERFVLIDADADIPIMDIYNGQQIEVTDLPTQNLSIQAIVNGNVESVYIQIRGTFFSDKIENYEPYTAFGDNRQTGDIAGRNFRLGDYLVRSTAHSEDNLRGDRSDILSVRFSIVDNISRPAVGSFTLVDPASDSDIAELQNGYVINRSTINVRANANDETESVRFYLLNSAGQVIFRSLENVVPYAAFGDRSGDYRSATLRDGVYYLKAVPYSANSAAGARGEESVIRFEIRANSQKSFNTDFTKFSDVETVELENVKFPNANHSVFPNPFTGTEFTVVMDTNVNSDATVIVSDATGRIILNENVAKGTSEHRVSLLDQNLGNGLYILRVESEGTEPFVQKLIKH
jgi:hypothetical protein